MGRLDRALADSGPRTKCKLEKGEGRRELRSGAVTTANDTEGAGNDLSAFFMSLGFLKFRDSYTGTMNSKTAVVLTMSGFFRNTHYIQGHSTWQLCSSLLYTEQM